MFPFSLLGFSAAPHSLGSLWSTQSEKVCNIKSCRVIFHWGIWGKISECKWMVWLQKLSGASLFTKLHSSERKELKARWSFKSLHCGTLTFYQTSQLLCISEILYCTRCRALTPWEDPAPFLWRSAGLSGEQLHTCPLPGCTQIFCPWCYR